MGSSNNNSRNNLEQAQTEYGQRFRDQVADFKAGPRQERSCNDICCFVTFFLMLLAFIAIGIYGFFIGKNLPEFLQSGGSITDSINETALDGINVVFDVFDKFVWQMIGMMAVGLVLSIIYLFLVKTLAGCVIYTSIVITFVVLIAAIVLGIVYQIWGLSIGAGVILLIFACILFCFWSSIKVGIILLRVAGDFIVDRPSVYLVPIFAIFMGILFIAFWVSTLVFIQFNAWEIQVANMSLPEEQQESITKHYIFYAIWIFYILFMAEFLYYVEVFLVSCACAFWYYGLEQNWFRTGEWWLNTKHIGSLTFGALLVAIISFLRRLVQGQAASQAGDGNAICAFCLCCVACCLGSIEALLKVLNQNSIIVMAVTGESYLGSAKSAIGIIFDNFGLFNIIEIFDVILIVAGVLLCAGIPALGIFLILQFGTTPLPEPFEIAIAVIIVFFMTMIVTVYIIGLLGLALNCVFIYFCLDKRLKAFGIYVPNVPPQIAEMFDQHQPIAQPSAQQLNR